MKRSETGHKLKSNKNHTKINNIKILKGVKHGQTQAEETTTRLICKTVIIHAWKQKRTQIPPMQRPHNRQQAEGDEVNENV